eukprot:5572387-Alexandrium_andersonii.AAC.1
MEALFALSCSRMGAARAPEVGDPQRALLFIQFSPLAEPEASRAARRALRSRPGRPCRAPSSRDRTSGRGRCRWWGPRASR